CRANAALLKQFVRLLPRAPHDLRVVACVARRKRRLESGGIVWIRRYTTLAVDRRPVQGNELLPRERIEPRLFFSRRQSRRWCWHKVWKVGGQRRRGRSRRGRRAHAL